ncbi:hypothetical protein HYV21_00995 [Candidatus Microgenomates bacterium]|nr:hypothetical protein [Candidatus Microgenomates bacterium]
MKRPFLSALFLLGIFALVLPKINLANAQISLCPTFEYEPKPLLTTHDEVTFRMGPTNTGERYQIEVDIPNNPLHPTNIWSPKITSNGGPIEYTFKNREVFATGTHKISLHGPRGLECQNTYTVSRTSVCTLSISPNEIDTSTDIAVSGTGVPVNANNVVVLEGPQTRIFAARPDNSGNFSVTIGKITPASDNYQIWVGLNVRAPLPGYDIRDVERYQECGIIPLKVGPPGTPRIQPGSGPIGEPGRGPQITACPNGTRGIYTAFGCIPVENTTEFVKWFLGWAIGIGGGIAFLLILWSGFQIMTSAGNPERLKAGREQLTAAIGGLLFLIFSVFLLRLIGVDILQLPGFGG